MKKLRNLALTSAACLALTGTVAAMPQTAWESSMTAQAAFVQGAAEDFLGTGYDSKNVTVYSAGATNFQMNGRTYYQGISFDNTSGAAEISYDVAGVEQLAFTIGHLDNSGENNATLNIYLDDMVYDTIDLNWTMELEEYTVDASGSDVLRIELVRGGWASGYALANVSVDGTAPASAVSVPEYGSAEQFMKSGFGVAYTTVNNTTSKSPAFYMNGRGYYQGLSFDSTSSAAKVCFNVENVDEISFTMGHIDGSGENTATVIIYLDNMEYDKFDLTWNMSLEEYTIDTTDSDVLRISIVRNGWNSGYAFAELTVDGNQPDKTFTVPEYDSAEQFMKSGFDITNTTVNNTTAKSPAFYMNGRGYYQGLSFDSTSSAAKVCFNVENVDEVSFTMGHIDGSGENTATVTIYLDNMEYDKFDLTWTMSLEEYTIDTTDSAVLYISVARNGWNSGYAFAELSVDGNQPDKMHTVPEYDSAEKFMKSCFGDTNMTVNNTTAKNPAFYMNGRGFYQGLSFDNTSSAAKACFNVENVDEVSFTIGHIDNSGENTATVTIYLDNMEYDKFDLTWTMSLEEYTIDTADSDVLRISVVRNGWASGYAFADFSVDSHQPAKTYTVPEYDSVDQFLKSGFSVTNMAVNNTSASNPAFKMNGVGYYQGFSFDHTSSGAKACFNVEKIDSISFTIGHIDDSGEANATLQIYLDNAEYDFVDLTADMEPMEYTIDTKGSDVLRIVVARNGWSSGYALGNISVVFSENEPDPDPDPDPVPEVVAGDVDGDGAVSLVDALRTLQWATEVMLGSDVDLTPEQFAAADVNGDGALTIVDAQMILIYYTNKTVVGNEDYTWEDILNGNR